MGGPPPSKPLHLLTRRPALSAAVMLIAGILLHPILPQLPILWLILSAAAIAAALLTLRWSITSTLSLAFSILLLGTALAQTERFHFPANHIALFTTDTPCLAEIELEISQPPRILAPPFAPGARALSPRQITTGQVIRIKTAAGWQPATGQFNLHIGSPDLRLAHGQRIAALGQLSRPAHPMNPGEFDWYSYYRDQRILASFSIERPQSIQILRPATFSTLNWLRQSARDALARGFSEARAVDHALLRALLLGDSDPQLRDIQDDFQKTGTSHHLSISGLHVAVLGGFVYFLCRLCRLTPRKAAISMMVFVLIYGLAALPAPPVVRSIILCEVFGIALLLRRSVDGIQLLAFTLFAMLIYQPLDLYNAGFQLSFGTVLGLMVMARPLFASMTRLSEDDRVLLSFGILPSPAGRFRRWMREKFAETFGAGLIAWLVSAPLIIQHFDQINPWAILASIALAPIVFASMLAGLFKIIFTLVLPWFANGWAALAAIPVAWMRHSVEWMATWPGSDLALPAIPVAFILIYYILLSLPLIPSARPALRWTFRGGAATACIAIILLPFLAGFAPQRGPGLKLTLLSIGAGQCAVIELPSGRTILVDAGSSTINDLHRRILRPFLRHEGITRIDAAFVSHANFDHFSAISPAAEAPGISRIFITPWFESHSAKSYPARILLDQLKELHRPVETLAAGQTLQLDEFTQLEVLWPPAPDPDLPATLSPKPLDINNSCQVLKITCRGKSILFTGDIQAPAETALLADPASLKADILIAPHHGSAERITDRFLDAITPEFILASNDKTLSGKQRAFDDLIQSRRSAADVSSALARSSPTFLRTHSSGAITLTIAPDGAIQTRTFLHP